MNIAILVDNFSGHLFHDVELFIVLFEKRYENIACIEFINMNGKIHCKEERNRVLCQKLFGADATITDDKERHYDDVIDRTELDHGNVNKAFAKSIRNFPERKWADLLSRSLPSNQLKILYSSRQETCRRLSDDAHTFILNLVRSYDGTICDDLGRYSIQEQIELFRHHNCVIGVHGNNLTGIMWMSPASHVFEILPFDCKDCVYDYHCMSLCMKHHYTQINGLGESHNCIMGLDNSSKKMLESHLHMLKSVMFSS